MTATASTSESRHQSPVSSWSTMLLTHRVLVRQVVTRGRLIMMGGLGALLILLAWAVDPTTEFDPLEAGVSLITNVGFTILVPMVALVFSAGVLGDTREDGTLVYLWLRPLRRWPVVVGAYTAALTVVAPLTIVPVVAMAVVLDVGGGLVGATLIASVVGVIAYTALFLLLGLFLKNAIVWGLAYILVWEGIAAALGTGPARMAIRGYTRSILTDRTGVELELADLSQTAGIVVPVLIAAVALALATLRLQRLDVA